jgi:autotransporter-associated beta strand protein
VKFSGTGNIILDNPQALGFATFNSTASSAGVLKFGPGALGSVQLGALAGTENFTLTDTLGGPVALTVGINNGNTEYDGVLTGGSDFTKAGSGVMIITKAQTYGGTTSITGGTLVLGNSTSPGSVPSTSITDTGMLTYAGSGNQTVLSNITGTGGQLNIAGATNYTVTYLGDASNMTGATNIAAHNTLQLGDGTSAHPGIVGGAINDSGNLILAQFGNVTFANTISGAGNIAISSGNLTFSAPYANALPGVVSGVETFSSSNDAGLNGVVTIAQGASLLLGSPLALFNATLNLTAGNATTNGTISFAGLNNVQLGGLTGNINLPIANLTFSVGFGNSTTYGGVLSGAGNLVVAGNNTVFTLLANQTYTGTTTINLGTLVLGNQTASVASMLANSTGNIVINSGQINTIVNASTTTKTPVTSNLTLNGSAGAVTFAKTLTGNGGLNISGAAGQNITLNSAQQYSGPTTVGANNILTIGDGATGGSILSSSTITDSGTVNINEPDSGQRTFNNNWAQANGLLALLGVSNVLFTPLTTDSKGNIINAQTAFNGSVIIAQNAVLTLGTNIALQNATLNITVGNASTNGTFSFGSLSNATLGGLIGNLDLALNTTTNNPVALTIGTSPTSTLTRLPFWLARKTSVARSI